MFEEVKKLIKAALTAMRQRIEGVESDVDTLKTDVADIKSVLDGLQSGALDDIKAEIDSFGTKGTGTAGSQSSTAAAIAASIPSEAVTPAVVQAAVDAHASATASGGDAVQAAANAATVAAMNANAPITTSDASAVASAVAAATPAAGNSGAAQPGDHPDPTMAAAGLPAAGPLPTAA